MTNMAELIQKMKKYEGISLSVLM